jgi:hypothetical protein
LNNAGYSITHLTASGLHPCFFNHRFSSIAIKIQCNQICLKEDRNMVRRCFLSVSIASLILSMSIPQASASWLSDFLGVNIDIPAGKVQIGTPQPIPALQRLPGVISRLPQDIANLANPAGDALAFALRQAKAQASFGAQPIPPYIRQVLQPYFPPDILNSVRFNTFDRARIGLDSAVMMLNNDVAAITLEDITVFRNQADAQTAYLLWAHELTHVIQFRSRGIDTFANMYTTNSWVLENEAKDRAAWVYQQTTAAAYDFGPPAPPPPVQATSNFNNFSYYNINNGLYAADANSAWVDPSGAIIMGLLYPCNPQTGVLIGPAVAVMTQQTMGPSNGRYIAFDSRGNAFFAIRLKQIAVARLEAVPYALPRLRAATDVWPPGERCYSPADGAHRVYAPGFPALRSNSATRLSISSTSMPFCPSLRRNIVSKTGRLRGLSEIGS